MTSIPTLTVARNDVLAVTYSLPEFDLIQLTKQEFARRDGPGSRITTGEVNVDEHLIEELLKTSIEELGKVLREAY
jgi:hypothetical protein